MPLFRRRLLLTVACVYVVVGLLRIPAEPGSLRGVPSVRLGSVAVSPPQVLSGDSPHYLVAVHSLIEDLDLDLSNNYAQAEAGDWDAGARFRGRPLDHHTEKDADGAELPTHSPFFAALLALMVWPFRETRWVEPACIWLTTLIGLAGMLLFLRYLRQRSEKQAIAGTLLLAFATPLWCYSRDLWTEPWVMTAWLGLLVLPGAGAAFLLGLAGTLIKYPFAVVPLVMGLWTLRGNEKKRGIALIAGGLAGLAAAAGALQVLFRQADHFSLFHSGIHAGFDWPFDGAAGLLFHPRDGLLPFFPVLLWAWGGLQRDRIAAAGALAFFLVHASYSDWQGGTGFSARYLTPLLPVLAAGAVPIRGDWLYRLALGWSLAWGLVGGLFPALVFDRTPWGAVLHLLSR